MDAATYERAVQLAVAEGRYDVAAELRRAGPARLGGVDGLGDLLSEAGGCLGLATTVLGLAMSAAAPTGGLSLPVGAAAAITACLTGGALSWLSAGTKAQLAAAAERQRQAEAAAAAAAAAQQRATWTWAAIAGGVVLGVGLIARR